MKIQLVERRYAADEKEHFFNAKSVFSGKNFNKFICDIRSLKLKFFFGIQQIWRLLPPHKNSSFNFRGILEEMRYLSWKAWPREPSTHSNKIGRRRNFSPSSCDGGLWEQNLSNVSESRNLKIITVIMHIRESLDYDKIKSE